VRAIDPLISSSFLRPWQSAGASPHTSCRQKASRQATVTVAFSQNGPIGRGSQNPLVLKVHVRAKMRLQPLHFAAQQTTYASCSTQSDDTIAVISDREAISSPATAIGRVNYCRARPLSATICKPCDFVTLPPQIRSMQWRAVIAVRRLPICPPITVRGVSCCPFHALSPMLDLSGDAAHDRIPTIRLRHSVAAICSDTSCLRRRNIDIRTCAYLRAIAPSMHMPRTSRKAAQKTSRR